METFRKLFGNLLAFVYHCFDRIVLLGHLPLLIRPEHIVYSSATSTKPGDHQGNVTQEDR